jgi:hypothetical protein
MAKITIEGNELVIRVDLNGERTESSSGKSMLIEASTTAVEHNGEEIKVGLNVYVPKKKKK